MAKLRGKQAIGRITGVSELNFAEEIRADMYLPDKVVINDLTLREGRQLEGLVATPEECVHIAEKLAEMGVPMIQLRVGRRHQEINKAIGKLNLKIKTECLSVAHQQVPPYNIESLKKEIDQCNEYNLGICPVLALSDDLLRAVSELRGEKKSLNYLKKEQVDLAVEAVEYARGKGTPINVNLQDFLRCDFQYLKEMCQALVKAGVGIITLDDIAGPALPSVYKYVVHKVKKAVPKATLGIHVHNDYGLALPAVLASFEGGCEVLDCGINGLGERAGHADLATLVADLEFLYGYDTGIRLEKLVEVSTLVADIFRQPLPKASPIVGEHAFSHCSDWHWQFPRYPWSVASLAPEVVGNITRTLFGSSIGPFGVKIKAEELGIRIPPKKVEAVTGKLYEELKWRRRPLNDDEIRRIITAAL